MKGYQKTSNAVFSLRYHLIIVIKYRRDVFTNNNMVNDLKNMILDIAKKHDVEIIEQQCGTDHIHILFSAKPTLEITKFINLIKGHSSRELRKKYKEFLSDKLWGDHFWSPSYFLATTGNVSLDTLKRYIEKQER